MITMSPAWTIRVRIAALLLVSAFVLISPSPAAAQLGLGSLVVTVSEPAAGSTVGGTVTVAARVSIVGSLTVRDVQFRVDGVNLGLPDATDPYSVPWNTKTASNGTHTLVAVARDLLGVTYASDPVTVTVFNDLTPPAVAVTAPIAGATVAGSVTISANASDNVGVVGVQFRLDGANLGGEDTTAPYSVAWNTTTVTSGPHTLTAVARDAAGNATTSAGITVTVDNVGPTVAISSPANGATVAGTITVTADTSDAGGVSGVQFRLDGANLGAEDTTAPYSVAWDTTAATNGSHTLTAVARDALGNTTTAAAVSVTVSNLTESVSRVEDSSASIAYSGSWVRGNTSKPWSGGTAALANGGTSAAGEPTRATLAFTGSGVKWIGFTGPQTGIAKVYLDGALVATVDAYAATETLGAVLYAASGLSATAHTLAIEATGTKHPSSSDIFVVVDAFDVTTTSVGGGADTTPPSVSITAPAANASVSGSVTVSATASDNNAVAGVQFRLNGANLGAEDTTAPYSVTWDTAMMADGPHTLSAVARDAAGNTRTSGDVTVTVSNGSPSPPSTVMTRFENTDPAIVYTPGSAAVAPPNWWHGSRSRAWSGGTAAFNRAEGARATFTFNGTSVAWISFRANWAGIARVYLDGAFVEELDLYSPTEQAQARVYTASGLASGTHTLAVESTGRMNAAAADNAVVVDAFDVGPAVPPRVAGGRIENTSASVTFTDGWAPATGGAAWSGGSAAASSTPGARATVTFSGTSVSLVGLRGPQTGIARVYLDGALQATVDTYSPAELQAVVFSATSLAAARHELIVEATGTKNAAATDHQIVVDAFDVRTRFEDVDSAVSYTGTWVSGDLSKAWSGTSANFGSGSAARSTMSGARAEFSFSGSSVTWIGYRGPESGIGRVYLDGSFVSEVDTYSAQEEVQAALFAASGLAAGPHVLAIEVTGLKNAASGNSIVVVDALDVALPPSVPPARRIGDADATYSEGGWTQSSPNALFAGATVTTSVVAGAAAEFAFTGSSIRWIGQRAFDGGIARVSIDGVPVAEIDTYAGVQEEFQAVMFSAAGLAAGAHTIRIEVTGMANAASAGTRIVVDAFDVIQ